MRWLLLALVGALICTVGDHLHATCGVLTYRQTAFWDQAWWVAPLFAGASLVCVLGARLFWSLGGPNSAPDMRRIAADGIGFFAAYAYTSFAAADRPTVTLLVLVVAFAVRVVGEARSRWLVLYCLLLGVGGCVFEGTLSATGAFHYLHPDVLGVPRWLFGIYLHAGLIAGELSLLMMSKRASSACPRPSTSKTASRHVAS